LAEEAKDGSIEELMCCLVEIVSSMSDATLEDLQVQTEGIIRKDRSKIFLLLAAVKAGFDAGRDSGRSCEIIKEYHERIIVREPICIMVEGVGEQKAHRKRESERMQREKEEQERRKAEAAAKEEYEFEERFRNTNEKFTQQQYTFWNMMDEEEREYLLTATEEEREEYLRMKNKNDGNNVGNESNLPNMDATIQSPDPQVDLEEDSYAGELDGDEIFGSEYDPTQQSDSEVEETAYVISDVSDA
jgi:hypothetical protein